MRKTIAALAIGALVIGGAAVAAAQTDEPEDAPTTTDHPYPSRGAVLLEVLDDLVADGVIDQSQRDAIVDALEARREEIQAVREELRQQIAEFWEDDVLTAEEIAQLPEWHPLRRLTEYLEDGQLTRDEVREARAQFAPRHHRGGPGGFATLDA